MPSNIATPALFEYLGGSIRSTRIKPARFRYTASSVTTSKSTPTTTAAEIPQLDRLRRFDKLMQGDQIDPRFQLIWQRTMEAIESAFEAVNRRVDEVAIFARLSAAEALAEAANDNAVVAKATVETVKVATQTSFDTVSPDAATRFAEELALLDFRDFL